MPATTRWLFALEDLVIANIPQTGMVSLGHGLFGTCLHSEDMTLRCHVHSLSLPTAFC